MSDDERESRPIIANHINNDKRACVTKRACTRGWSEVTRFRTWIFNADHQTAGCDFGVLSTATFVPPARSVCPSGYVVHTLRLHQVGTRNVVPGGGGEFPLL
jgi:hypothetical protein